MSTLFMMSLKFSKADASDNALHKSRQGVQLMFIFVSVLPTANSGAIRYIGSKVLGVIRIGAECIVSVVPS